jgi:hypothetical protein
VHAPRDGSEHTDLAAGSGVEFHDRGEREAKGCLRNLEACSPQGLTRPETCCDIERGGHPEGAVIGWIPQVSL